jgi:hypothetical protein
MNYGASILSAFGDACAPDAAELQESGSTIGLPADHRNATDAGLHLLVDATPRRQPRRQNGNQR